MRRIVQIALLGIAGAFLVAMTCDVVRNTQKAGCTGSDGVLNVTSGTTNIAASHKSYSSLNVSVGATLNITGSGWAVISVCENATINGTITAKGDSTTGGTFNDTDPDGGAISYTITQANGGSGGANNACQGSPTGSPSYAQGGGSGGGGQSAYGAGSAGSSSIGGTGSRDEFTIAGGAGGSAPSNGGGAGSCTSGCVSGMFSTTGGGGGARGYHGKGVYLKVFGTLSGSGTIDVSGSSGGSGGQGGDGVLSSDGGAEACYSGTFVNTGRASAIYCPGNGGGGGAGGSGGKVTIRSLGGHSGWTGSILTSGGSAGSGGRGGYATACTGSCICNESNPPTGSGYSIVYDHTNYGVTGSDGTTGGSGSAGSAGSSSISDI